MTIEEMVKESREQQRQAFGKCEIKEDCTHYGVLGDQCSCKILTEDRNNKLRCEVGVCYFYERK